MNAERVRLVEDAADTVGRAVSRALGGLAVRLRVWPSAYGDSIVATVSWWGSEQQHSASMAVDTDFVNEVAERFAAEMGEGVRRFMTVTSGALQVQS